MLVTAEMPAAYSFLCRLRPCYSIKYIAETRSGFFHLLFMKMFRHWWMNLSSMPVRMKESWDQSRENPCFYDVLEDVLSDLTRLVSKEAQDHPGTYTISNCNQVMWRRGSPIIKHTQQRTDNTKHISIRNTIEKIKEQFKYLCKYLNYCYNLIKYLTSDNDLSHCNRDYNWEELEGLVPASSQVFDLFWPCGRWWVAVLGDKVDSFLLSEPRPWNGL